VVDWSHLSNNGYNTAYGLSTELDFFFSLNNCEFLSDAYLAGVEALAQGGLFRAHANFIHGLIFLSV
jgi:hypothetical protein